MPRVTLIWRDPLLQEFQRIERSHHGPRKIKPRGQGLAPVGLDASKSLFRLSEKAFDRHRGGPFLDHFGKLFAALGKGLVRVASILSALPAFLLFLPFALLSDGRRLGFCNLGLEVRHDGLETEARI